MPAAFTEEMGERLADLRRAGSVLASEVARHGQPLFERAPARR